MQRHWGFKTTAVGTLQDPYKQVIQQIHRMVHQLPRVLHHGLDPSKHASVHAETPNAACAQAHCLAEFGAATAFATAHFLKFLDLTFSPFLSKEG